MSNNINFKIDVLKLNKDRFEKNTFTTREGVVVNELNANLVAVERKEPKIIKDTPEWTLKETHFVVEKQTKEERQNKVQSKIVGSGTQFVSKDAPEEQTGGNSDPLDDFSADQIPF